MQLPSSICEAFLLLRQVFLFLMLLIPPTPIPALS